MNPNEIKELRRLLGNVSQLKFAIRVGVSPLTISRWERGVSHPEPGMARKLWSIRSTARKAIDRGDIPAVGKPLPPTRTFPKPTEKVSVDRVPDKSDGGVGIEHDKMPQPYKASDKVVPQTEPQPAPQPDRVRETGSGYWGSWRE